MSKERKKRFNFLVIGTAITLPLLTLMNIGGLIQAWETIEEKFPKFTKLLIDNAIPALFTIVTILGVCLFLLLRAHKSLKLELEKRIDKERNRKIVLFLSPCPDGSFYLQHFSFLVKQAAARANANLEMLISFYCPQEAFSGTDPECLYDSVEMFPGKVSGIFMIPASPDDPENRNRIKKFKQDFGATVLLDVYPGTESNGAYPDFVGGDEVEGGKQAASLAVDYIYKAEIEFVNILILRGRSTEWELQRATAFEELLIEEFGQERLVIRHSKDLNYNRGEARRYVELEISRCILQFHRDGASHTCKSFELIYACNDDMALGALDAIENSEKNLPGPAPKIIGYDGTDEMKSLIKSGHPLILGTVEVHIEDQARRAVDAMLRLLSGNKPQVELNLIKPESVFANPVEQLITYEHRNTPQ